MRTFFQNQFSTIQRFLSKHPWFSQPEKYSVAFLNSTQFLGALNDNIYKLVLIFFLIQLEGPEHASSILSVAGAIFVIPFLLFSSMAGILADRFSKSRLIICVKTSEIFIILLAIVSFAFKLKWGSYALLFLLSTQSAMFGPSKYGIIPELVPKNKVSKANGLIVSFTYLAIILGTFLASFLTEMTNRNYVFIGFFCLLVSIAGFISSFGIKYTEPKGTTKKLKTFFLKQLTLTLIECRNEKHLLTSIFGSAYFLFIGGFTQLNIIPYAIESLGFTEVAGGWLFLVTALGIASGALLAGRASRTQIQLGLSCIASVLISIFLILFPLATSSLTAVVSLLFLLGFTGGFFVVPFDSFIQVHSPETNRGHVIAASNFLSFVGVLFASLAIYLFNGFFELSAAKSFAVIGYITAIVSIVLFFKLSDMWLSLISRKIINRIHKIKTKNLEIVFQSPSPILMLENASWLKAWMLCGVIPNLHIVIPQYRTRSFPWFQNLFYSIHRIASPRKFEQLVRLGRQFSREETVPCIYITKKIPPPEKTPFFRDFLRKKHYELITVSFEKPDGSKHTMITFSK